MAHGIRRVCDPPLKTHPPALSALLLLRLFNSSESHAAGFILQKTLCFDPSSTCATKGRDKMSLLYLLSMKVSWKSPSWSRIINRLSLSGTLYWKLSSSYPLCASANLERLVCRALIVNILDVLNSFEISLSLNETWLIHNAIKSASVVPARRSQS